LDVEMDDPISDVESGDCWFVIVNIQSILAQGTHSLPMKHSLRVFFSVCVCR
jgi:hypothetical protein